MSVSPGTNAGRALLTVEDLRVTFATPTGPVRAVQGVDMDVDVGQILGIVGESGCGKSAAVRALLGLSPGSAVVEGRIHLNGEPSDLSGALGPVSSMIYQNPGAALNPVFTVGRQLEMVADAASGGNGGVDRSDLVDLLSEVGLPEPERAMSSYPHELSGGMRQRAVIALALAQNPALLVADEPTTALDVTTQLQILQLLRRLCRQRNLTVIFVSHDLAVIREVCDRVAVMYAGRVVETGATSAILDAPSHPYTRALLESTPGRNNIGQVLKTIDGQVPDGRSEITGCPFAARCDQVEDRCRDWTPVLMTGGDNADSNDGGGSGHRAACLLIGDGS